MAAGAGDALFHEIRSLILELWDRPRSPSSPEAARIRAYFADVALRRQPNVDEVDERIAIASQGQLCPGTYVDRRIAKHLLHVRLQREWPSNASIADYMDSLERAIRNPNGAIYVEWYDEQHAAHRVVFVARGRTTSRGLRGGRYVVVTFLLKAGEARWLTGYQPGEAFANIARQRALLGGVWLIPSG